MSSAALRLAEVDQAAETIGPGSIPASSEPRMQMVREIESAGMEAPLAQSAPPGEAASAEASTSPADVPPSDPVTVPAAELAERLPTAQHSALAALTDGASFPAAAAAAGVHRATVYRWLASDPLFRAAYNAWQAELRASARARLLKLADEAVDVVAQALRKRDDVKVAMSLLSNLGVLAGRAAGETDPALLRAELELARNEREQLIDIRSARHVLAKAGLTPSQQQRYLRDLRDGQTAAGAADTDAAGGAAGAGADPKASRATARRPRATSFADRLGEVMRESGCE